MKRIISVVLLSFLLISICACANSNDEVAKKVSEYSDNLNEVFQGAFGELPSGETVTAPYCQADGRDLIIIYEHDSSVDYMTTDDWAELALNDDWIHYPRFEELVTFAGDDSVRLLIKYVGADGTTLYLHTIDKAYEPYSTPSISVIDPTGEPDSLEDDLNKFCNDNAERLAEEYSGLLEGATGPVCYTEVESLRLVLEYRYSEDISTQQFSEAIEEAAAKLRSVADELTEATGNASVVLVIRCFDVNGEKLLDYPIGGMTGYGEM